MKNPFEKEKKKGRIERLGGFVKKTVGWETIKDTASYISKDVNTLKEQYDSSVNNKNKHIDFETAFKQNNLDEEGLQKIYKNLKTSFYANLLILIIFILGFIYICFNNSFNIFYGLSTFGFLLIIIASLFRFSFRCRQIAEREFIPVNIWLKNPSFWIPAKEICPKKSAKIIKKSKVLKF